MIPALRHPQPLKHVRYARKAMTVCIGALCERGVPGEVFLPNGLPVFVLCSDGMLSSGPAGADRTATKVHRLGHNFIAMIAATNWDIALDACGYVEQAMMRARRPQTKEEAVKRLKSSLKAFKLTALFEEGTETALLITGFIGYQPVMLTAYFDKDCCEVKVRQGSAAVGEGSLAALNMLNNRGINSLNVRFENACYLVYESKKFSEVVGSVGANTYMFIHAPVLSEDPDSGKYVYGAMTPNGFAKLEALRQRFYLQEIAGIGGFDLHDIAPNETPF